MQHFKIKIFETFTCGIKKANCYTCFNNKNVI